MKYFQSILISLLLCVSLILSHNYLPHYLDQIYKILLIFILILYLFWKAVLTIFFLSLFVVLVFWLTDQYVAHPLDFLIQAITVCCVIFISFITKNQDR